MSLAYPSKAFRRYDYVFSLYAEVAKRLSEHLFAAAFRIDIGSVEEVDTFVYARFNQLVGFILLSRPNHFEEFAAAMKCHGAKA
ncbi:MAG: hypothetical protein BWY75_02113 [bacterium ADurb.Bin425]|nr:MAG: hypothetical protein BWY75_02113 [bacterium ADurb.Bin425]